MSVEPESAAAGRLLAADAPPHWRGRALERVRHGFFGRRGGVSSGLYASLNAGTGSNDAQDAVRENRRRIAAALGAAPDRLIGVHQVHSACAVAVDAPWPGARPHADALVTATPGLVLSVLTADCAPVLLADVEAGVIGAAHAGWKGALAGVLGNAVAGMAKLGAQPSRIAALVGPCIQPASYAIGPEFEAQFCSAEAGNARFFADGPVQRHFDLPGYCVWRLQQAGVGAVQALAHDTYAETEALFSHRRSVHEKAGDYGRNCAAIVLG